MNYRRDTTFLVLTDIHAIKDDMNRKAHCLLMIKECASLIRKSAAKDPIDYILILGDLSNQGNSGGKWFLKELLKQFPNPKEIKDKILIIPGNHDLNRKELKKNLDFQEIFYYPKKKDKNAERRKASEIIARLNIKTTEQLTELGNAYFKPFLGGYDIIKRPNGYNPLFGIDFNLDSHLCFIRINTCWNALNSNSDYGNIVIGKRLVFELCEKIKLELDKNGLRRKDVTIVTLMHHPPAWWSYSELFSANPRDSTTYGKLLSFTDLLLCGHTHGTYTGYSVIHDEAPSQDIPSTQKTLFLEAPASLVSGGTNFYPTCFFLLKLKENHNKLERFNYIYDQRKDVFTSGSPITMQLPRYLDFVESKYEKKDFLALPKFDELDIKSFNILKAKALMENRQERERLIISTIQSLIQSKDSIISKPPFYLQGKNYWKVFDTLTDKPIDKSLSDFLISGFRELDKLVSDSGVLNILILYQNRFKPESSTFVDYEDYIYNEYNKILKKIPNFFGQRKLFLYLRPITEHVYKNSHGQRKRLGR